MELDLEAQMAKALEGKFFWEPTSSPSDDKTPMQKEIYEAQKFGPRKIVKSSIAIIDETEAVEQFLKPRMLREAEIRAKPVKDLNDLRSIVAACYQVSVDDLLRHTNNKAICEAKRHFYWAAIKHFPEWSIAEIGRQLKRNHTTIMHSRNVFAKNMDKYKEQIAYVDGMMRAR
jgi:hypothetical protein